MSRDDEVAELQRMADYLECRWGERPVGPPWWLTSLMAARPHLPECGTLSVPDVLVVCQVCGGGTDWCGCMYRCPKCEAKS